MPTHEAQVYACAPPPGIIYSIDLTVSGLDPSVLHTFEVDIININALGLPYGYSTFEVRDSQGLTEETFEVYRGYFNASEDSGCVRIIVSRPQSVGATQLAPFTYSIAW